MKNNLLLSCQIMLPLDLITNISGFIKCDKLKYICSDLYENINSYNKSKEWQDKYNNYLVGNNVLLPALNGNYVWKHEYELLIINIGPNSQL